MERQLVSFDWALKKLLRSKANFFILEGFLSELLHENIKIQEILESESNKYNDLDKSNRVDLLVKNQNEEFIIIEVQYDYQASYFHRILFGTSKIITENIFKGMEYDKIKKVISVSIVYFDLGQGEDYVYKGTTKFFGLHKNDELKLNDNQKKIYGADEVHKIYPEYYILKINQFNDVAKDGLDEWIYFLKNEKVKESFKAKGLKKAVEELNIMKLPPEEQQAFKRYAQDLMQQTSQFNSSYGRGKMEGEEKGRKEGREEGREEGEKIGVEKGKLEEKIAMAKKMKCQGIALEIIAEVSGLSKKQLEGL